MAVGIAAGGVSALVSASRSPEDDVAAVIASYGQSLEVSRNGKKAAQYRVKMHGIEKFKAVFNSERRLPFDRILVSAGNTLRFNHRGVDFTIVNIV